MTFPLSVLVFFINDEKNLSSDKQFFSPNPSQLSQKFGQHKQASAIAAFDEYEFMIDRGCFQYLFHILHPIKHAHTGIV